MSSGANKHLGTKRIEDPPLKDYSTYSSRVLLGENPLPEGFTRLILDAEEVAVLVTLSRRLAERGLGEEFFDDNGVFDLKAACRTLVRLSAKNDPDE